MESIILQSLLLRPGMQGHEALLTDMIKDCIDELRDMLNYRDVDVIPTSLYGVIKELVLIKFNQDGAQGIVTESQSSGGSTTYTSDIPPSLKRRIYRHRKMRRGL